MSNQGLRQASVRAVTGTAETYEGDWHALFDLDGIPVGPFNGRLLAWINSQLTLTYTSLPEAMAAYAVFQGYSSWDEMGTFEPGGQPDLPILSRITMTGVAAFSFNRVLVDGYSGPLARIRRASDNADLDYTTIEEAEAFVGASTATVRGLYDQYSGTMLVPNVLTRPWRQVATGLYGIRWGATTDTIALNATMRAALGGLSGLTMSMVVGDVVTTTNSTNFMQISLAASTTSRHLIRSSAGGGDMEFGGRTKDADTAALNNIGNFGANAICTGVFDFTGAKIKMFRAGALMDRTDPFQAASAGVTDGTPQQAILSGLVNATTCEAVFGASALSDADALLLDADQRDVYSALIQSNTQLWDGIRSWWVHNLDIVDNGILTTSFTTSNGAQGFAEVDATTLNLIDARILQWGEFGGADDHQAPGQIKLDDGSRLTVMTGHGKNANGSGGSTGFGNHTYFYAKSPTGRIADFGALSTITNTIGQSNYITLIQSPTTNDVWCMTNDDSAVSWLSFLSTDRGDNWTELRGFYRQAVAPGGGQNQLYSLFRQLPGTDTVRIAALAHPSNSQNQIRLASFDLVSRELSSGSGVIQDLDTGVGALPDVTTLTSVYTPPAGKSARLLDISDDGSMLLIQQRNDDASGGGSGEYGLLLLDGYNAATYKPIAASGAPLGSTLYPQGAQFAREAHTGIRVIYARESGGTYSRCRANSADNGDTWSETVLETSSTPFIRPSSPIGATAALSMVWAAGTYTDYDAFSTVLRWAA